MTTEAAKEVVVEVLFDSLCTDSSLLNSDMFTELITDNIHLLIIMGKLTVILAVIAIRH